MSDTYSKTDIRQIAERFVEDLRECDNGTSMTTAELAKNIFS